MIIIAISDQISLSENKSTSSTNQKRSARMRIFGWLASRVLYALYPFFDLISLQEFLHSRANPIVHRDLKPGNVLLDATRTAFLCDFGLTTVI